MVHTLPLLLALSIAPAAASAAAPAFEPASATTGAVLEQPARTTSYDRSGSLFGQAGSSLSGLPTFGASSSNVTVANRGRMDTGGGQMLDYYTIKVGSDITGSGFAEEFIVFTPNVPKGVVRPLLVPFHKYGVTQKDIVYNTPFLQECAKRGWFMLAPVSASGGHFMCDPGQKNTELAMDWMKANFSIDMSKIYGVGFSMGGGMALNFAARHLDPKRWTFAAIVNHTGAVDIIDTYENDPASAFVFDFWYGQGSPGTANYDKMRRASLIEWDPSSQQINPKTDLARNLDHIPLKFVRATNDPLADLVVQHDRLDAHLQAMGRVPGPSYSYEIKPGNDHVWATLDYTAACDWLSQWSLNLPTEQRTLAATGGYYYDFLVMQTNGSLMTPFTWEVDTFNNAFRLSETANMAQLVVFLQDAGLDPTQQLTVTMSTDDGLQNKVLLKGFATKPTSVSRDGMVLPETHWSYAAAAGLVTITEWDGTSVHTFTIQP